MARKEIRNPLNSGELNNFNSNFKELYKGVDDASQKIKDAEKNIDEKIDGIIGDVSNEALEKAIDVIKDSATWNWLSPVDTYSDLPKLPLLGDTVQTLDDGKVYRFDGTKWEWIQQIDAGPVNKLEKDINKKDIMSFKDWREGYYSGPIVCFVFDDGRKEMWDIFKELFESEGVPANVPVVTDSIDVNPSYMTTSQLKELQSLGWSISSHTATHINANQVSLEEVDDEYRSSSEWLKERGFSADIIVYPYGATSPETRKIASKYYKMGVNIVRNNLSNEIPLIDNLNLNRLAGLSQPTGAGPTYSEMKQRFDVGLVRNEFMIYEDHPQYSDWTPTKIEELRTFIRYIKSKGVPIVNLEDAYQMKCNIIDVGERIEGDFYKLHRNGQDSRGDEVFNLASTDSFDASTSAKDYPVGKITKYRINDNLDGLPVRSTGELIMDKTSPYESNWKMDYYTNGLVYYRMWRSDSWTRWYSYGEVIGDVHFTVIPPANVSNWRRQLLVRGHNSHEDIFITCMRKADGSFAWMKSEVTEYS